MTARTSANRGATDAAGGRAAGGAESTTTAPRATAAGAAAQSAVRALPIIRWRAAAPATMSSSRISQLNGLAYVAG